MVGAYECSHTLLCYLSPTWVFIKPASALLANIRLLANFIKLFQALHRHIALRYTARGMNYAGKGFMKLVTWCWCLAVTNTYVYNKNV
jgi:hypothetical protein